MKNIIYVRVSTDDQKNDLQLDACGRYASNMALLDVGIIEDKISGTATSRPGFDRLMKAVRAGGVERVIVYKLDRLGRSLPHLAMILEEFKSRGVALVATSQNIDTSSSSPAGTLQLHVLMAIAEFERAMIKERVNAGIAAAQSRGVKFGRTRMHNVTVEQVLAYRAEGKSWKQISELTGVNRGSLYRLGHGKTK